MSTCIFYVDEAGTPLKHNIPLKDGESPLFTLGAIALPMNSWREIDRHFLALKRHYFPDWLSDSSKRDEYFEIKGNALTAPRSADSDRKHAYLKAVLKFIESRGGGKCCFGVSLQKNPVKPTAQDSIYTISLQILAERFNQFIAEHPDYDKGIIICDSRKGMGRKKDTRVAKSYMSYVFGHDLGRSLINLVEAPLFADSKITVGLQLADTFCSVLHTVKYQNLIGKIEGAVNYDHMKQYWSIINSMEFKSRDSSQPLYGYRTLNHNKA